MKSPNSPTTVTRVSVSSGHDSSTPQPAAKPSRLWLWFVAAFALQLAMWTAWIVIASQHKVQEVPLATSPRSQN